MKTQLTHGSLFSGVGGFELGAKMASIPTVWNSEYEPHKRLTLARHFPETKQYTDVTTMSNIEYVDIISGGFPCQDISIANVSNKKIWNNGKVDGINGERSGLWGEMFRICREVRPRYIIFENSPMLVVRGFERVLLGLSEIGYMCEWQCISNLSFGYPHKRERIYAIAYSNEIGSQSDVCEHRTFNSIFKKRASNPDDGYSLSKRILEMPACKSVRNGDGFSHWTHRVGSIGNAVNPTVAYYLFECIKLHNQLINE